MLKYLRPVAPKQPEFEASLGFFPNHWQSLNSQYHKVTNISHDDNKWANSSKEGNRRPIRGNNELTGVSSNRLLICHSLALWRIWLFLNESVQTEQTHTFSMHASQCTVPWRVAGHTNRCMSRHRSAPHQGGSRKSVVRRWSLVPAARLNCLVLQTNWLLELSHS